MRYLDRHALAKIIEYERLADVDQEQRDLRSAEVEQWLTVAYDHASTEGRVAFVDLQKPAGVAWPWSAFETRTVDLSSFDDDLTKMIDRAPPVLLLVLLRDTTEPELTDPDNWLGDGDEWIPLRDALLSWAPKKIESYMNTGIWSPPAENIDANDAGTQGGSIDDQSDSAGDTRPEDSSPPVATPPEIPSVWKSWQLWTAVGVAVVATFGVSRIGRGG